MPRCPRRSIQAGDWGDWGGPSLQGLGEMGPFHAARKVTHCRGQFRMRCIDLAPNLPIPWRQGGWAMTKAICKNSLGLTAALCGRVGR